jgi:hypothetical protein
MSWKTFYSYSHKDAELRDELGTYLAPLVKNKKIVEWYDRKIEPGSDWDTEIKEELTSAHLILLLISKDFLASEYCFGVEVELALTRLKRGDVKVVPILLTKCLWEESRFSELQIIPRDAKAVTSSSWTSREDAFIEVANEIRNLVNEPPSALLESDAKIGVIESFDSSLDLVRGQVRSYAHLYERIRQRMRPSNERNRRLEEVFHKMRSLAVASYPLLDELANSPSPGERLAAVAILQVFASQRYLQFLVNIVGSEKPFVGYHAIRALSFAVGAIDPRAHQQLLAAIGEAKDALKSAGVGSDRDRQIELDKAEQALKETIDSLASY